MDGKALPPATENSDLDTPAELPIVFYCSDCNTIIGDSLSWACSDEDLQILVLSRVRNTVTVDDKLQTSSEKGDLGSTFSLLKCSSCKRVLGKMYKTTPRSMDQMRDIYSINVTAIDSYQLGTAEQGSSVSAEDVLTVPQAKTLHSKLCEVQHVMLSMHSRLVTLESAANITHESFQLLNAHQDKENSSPSQSKRSKKETVK